jgi:deoxyribonuclease-4
MAILGAHMSIAGGYSRAVDRAAEVGCRCVQIFTKNTNQWKAKPITPGEAENFRNALAQRQIGHPIAHDSYLINLASPDETLWRKSLDAFVEELSRAEMLGIPYLVTHPGCSMTASAQAGLLRVVQALDEIHVRTQGFRVQCLLETTAGQGSSLGWQFEELAAIFEGVAQPERLGVCFDTCHVFAAGYALGTRREYLATMRQFDRLIGLERIRAFHLNDSKRERGSRVDRHAGIGRGHLGVEPLRHLLTDRRFRNTPMYLETPKGKEEGEDLDVVNLRTLRELLGKISDG